MPDGIDVRVSVDGADDLLHKLTRAVAAETRAPAMQRLTERLLERLKTYPPPPPSSTYERTGTLASGWAVAADASGTNQFADRASVQMRNSTSYGPFVQGDPRDGSPSQAWMHQGRWETTREALDAETGPFLSDLSNTIERAFSGR